MVDDDTTQRTLLMVPALQVDGQHLVRLTNDLVEQALQWSRSVQRGGKIKTAKKTGGAIKHHAEPSVKAEIKHHTQPRIKAESLA